MDLIKDDSIINSNVIISGIGRVGGFMLNLISKDVRAVVTHSLEFGDNALDIQKNKSEKSKTIPAPKYSTIIPAFTDIVKAIEIIKNDEIIIFDVSINENFRNILCKIAKLAQYNYKNKNFKIYTCTPDQDGETEKCIFKLKNINNIRIVRDDLKLVKTENTIAKNYNYAKKIGGKCIITDIHRASKEPWAAILKTMANTLTDKKLSDKAYNKALTQYKETENDIEKRIATPIEVDEWLSISSFRSISADELECETAFIFECFYKDENGNEKQCAVDENGQKSDSVILAIKKYGEYVAKEMIKLCQNDFKSNSFQNQV